MDKTKLMSYREVQNFKIGNKVKVKSHQTTTMHGDSVEAYTSGHEGYLVGFDVDYSWRTEPNLARVRLYFDKDPQTGEFEHATNFLVELDLLEVLEDSVGEVVPGKTCMYSRSELRDMFIKQQLAEIEKMDFSAQGYKNMATHLAALYLNQDSRFHQQLSYLRRVDGTVNPTKVRKAFVQLGLSVDECASEVPDKFSEINLKYYREIHDAILSQQAIDWTEVAEDFSA